GGVAIAGFVAMALTGIRMWPELWTGPRKVPEVMGIVVHPTSVLIASVMLSLAAYGVARCVAAWTFASRVRASLDASTDQLARLARLEAGEATRSAVRLAAAGEAASFALPMAGIALLAPLTIHLAIWCAFRSALGGHPASEGFDEWIGMSL